MTGLTALLVAVLFVAALVVLGGGSMVNERRQAVARSARLLVVQEGR